MKKRKVKKAVKTSSRIPEGGMTVIVKTITRLLIGAIFVFGFYIIFHGHLTPGGGFSGGVILATAMILLILAYGKKVALEHFGRDLMLYLECFGGLMFLLIALLGLSKGAFFQNFLGKGIPFDVLSGGFIWLSNLAIGLKVWAALFAIYLALIVIRVTDKGYTGSED